MIEPLLNPREMTMGWVRGACAVTLCFLLFVVAAAAAEKGDVMSEQATGTFEVKIVPETIAGKTPAPGLSQMSIDKTFHGDLEGSSRGSMISAGNPKAGEAGYVAMEIVTGRLKGRAGSFALMHRATMSGGTAAMEVTVVPGSGTQALKGIAGTFIIHINNGQHSYDFDYELPE
ncbi:MAG TPA: DUF3224 domain-containing protein [Rhizomicrobium sp.]|nr:DUF3224 domain-containing protein [Rhizomicrobium sp.]